MIKKPRVIVILFGIDTVIHLNYNSSKLVRIVFLILISSGSAEIIFPTLLITKFSPLKTFYTYTMHIGSSTMKLLNLRIGEYLRRWGQNVYKNQRAKMYAYR